jgi:membrane AbrB-like protein
VFALAELPAPWLSGSVVAVGIAAIVGWRAYFPAPLRDPLFILLGLTLGAGVTPEIVARIPNWPVTIVLMLVATFCVAVAGRAYLQRVAGWDSATATYAAIPGALSLVLILAATNRANVPRVIVAQGVRLFFLIAALPSILVALEPAPVKAVSRAGGGPIELIGLLAACYFGAWLLERLRFPAAAIAGALLVSATLHGSGLTAAVFPPWVVALVFVVLGTMIGFRFAGVGFREILSAAPAAVVTLAISLVVALAFALLAGLLVDEPQGQILLAFAPGGLDAMAILAISLGYDTAFVAVHQILRVVAITLALPLITGKRKDDAP